MYFYRTETGRLTQLPIAQKTREESLEKQICKEKLLFFSVVLERSVQIGSHAHFTRTTGREVMKRLILSFTLEGVGDT